MADLSTRANERQVGGEHYKDAEFQHWDWAAENFGPDYFLGNITKYVTRWRKKSGVQDLEKALHYADKLYGLYNTGVFLNLPLKRTPKEFTRFAVANSLGSVESRICSMCASYTTTRELLEVRSWIMDLIAAVQDESRLTS